MWACGICGMVAVISIALQLNISFQNQYLIYSWLRGLGVIGRVNLSTDFPSHSSEQYYGPSEMPY